MNHSKRMPDIWLQIDYGGILLLALSDFVLGIYLVFHCEPTLQKVHKSITCRTPKPTTPLRKSSLAPMFTMCRLCIDLNCGPLGFGTPRPLEASGSEVTSVPSMPVRGRGSFSFRTFGSRTEGFMVGPTRRKHPECDNTCSRVACKSQVLRFMAQRVQSLRGQANSTSGPRALIFFTC